MAYGLHLLVSHRCGRLAKKTCHDDSFSGGALIHVYGVYCTMKNQSRLRTIAPSCISISSRNDQSGPHNRPESARIIGPVQQKSTASGGSAAPARAPLPSQLDLPLTDALQTPKDSAPELRRRL